MADSDDEHSKNDGQELYQKDDYDDDDYDNDDYNEKGYSRPSDILRERDKLAVAVTIDDDIDPEKLSDADW